MSMDIALGLFSKVPKIPERSDKGKNLLEFPESFVVIDIETTGFSSECDQILEVGAIRVDNGNITDTFSSLASYPDGSLIDDFITELTGITRDMIEDAPDISTVLSAFVEFIGNSIVLGHNTNFDINFIYDESVRLYGHSFSNDFVDTMRLSRRLHPEEKHHRLSDVADRYSIKKDTEHRALSDCETTLLCYHAIKEDILQTFDSFDTFIKQKCALAKSIKSKDITGDTSKVRPNCDLYEKVCVITGKLDKFTRKEAMQLIADIGGINADGITKKTNYLILGNTDYSNNIKDGKSNKLKKAEELKLKGFDIEIIPEDVFYEMVLSE